MGLRVISFVAGREFTSPLGDGPWQVVALCAMLVVGGLVRDPSPTTHQPTTHQPVAQQPPGWWAGSGFVGDALRPPVAHEPITTSVGDLLGR